MAAPPPRRDSKESATPPPGPDSLLPPSQPTEPTAPTAQQPPPRPYTSFRPYLRDFVKSRLPPPAGKDSGPVLPNKWDEVCMQWCSQRRLNREDGEAPKCQMVCLRRRERKEGMEVVQEEGAPRASKPAKGTWNLLDGYFLYVATRMEECQQHMEDMTKPECGETSNDPLKRNPAKISDEYEIDLGKQIDRTTAEATRIIKKTFNPSIELAQRYARSWTDGTQAAFFGRFAESVRRADAVHLVRESARKVAEKTFGGREGGANEERKDESKENSKEGEKKK